MAESQAADFAQLVTERTGGNPFFLLRYLRYLNEREPRLLFFDERRGVWTVPLETVRADSYRADNVLHMLQRSIEAMRGSTRTMLRTAACFGRIFRLSHLRKLLRSPSLLDDIDEALTEAVLVPAGHDTFKFTHDRVHASCAQLPSDEPLASVFVRTGMLLLDEWIKSGGEMLLTETDEHSVNAERRHSALDAPPKLPVK